MVSEASVTVLSQLKFPGPAINLKDQIKIFEIWDTEKLFLLLLSSFCHGFFFLFFLSNPLWYVYILGVWGSRFLTGSMLSCFGGGHGREERFRISQSPKYSE